MKTYLQAYFDELKCRVLDKAKIVQIVPADCYRLALEIKTATQKSVSETTLKRVFGFASSIHQPSIYTLNALAEYCDFSSWNSFYTHMEQDKLETSQQRSWSEILLSATKISLFSIQSNKHKCGIPYHKTVDRENMSQFVDHMENSGATVGILSGPVGSGKTVAITRWVEQQIGQNHTGGDNSIFLFTNSLSLLQGTAFGYHSNRWLAHLLGMDSAELLDRFMEDHKNAAPGKFYLVIDEFHSDLVADRQFYTVISQFVEMARHFSQYDWFRIILVLRTSTLFKYEPLFNRISNDPMWFSSLGSSAESSYASINTFSNTELYQLARNFNLPAPMQSVLAGQSIIRNPLFFQYFYECYETQMDLANMTPFDEYLIMAQYIRKKIFNGVNSIAKQALMEELSDFFDQGHNSLSVGQKQIYNIIKQHRVAYNDLLYAGILHEKGTGLEMRQQTVVEFQSVTFIAYFKALKLFNQQLSATELADSLNFSTACADLKISQLKWLLLFYIEAKDTQLFQQLENISFAKENPFLLTAFICDGLQKLSRQTHRANGTGEHHDTPLLRNTSFVQYVSSQLCLRPEYKGQAAKLLDFDLSAAQEISIRSKLAVIALLRWDENELLSQLEGLADCSPDAFAGLLFNPLHLLSQLYRYFKDRTISEALLHELDKLALRMQPARGETDFALDISVYLAAKVTARRDIARGYSQVIRQRLDKTAPEKTQEVAFTSLICALFLLEIGEEQAAVRCVERLSPDEIQQYAVLRLLHTFYNIHLLDFRGKPHNQLVRSAAVLSESHRFKLLETYCSLLQLKEMPKKQQLRQISNLKVQLTTTLPGYTHLHIPNKYG